MSPYLIIGTIAGYFRLLFVISWITNHSKSSTGSKVPWWASAIAAMGAPISGVTFISVPGMVITKEWSYMQMCFGFIIGYFVVAYVLIPLFFRRKLVSIYGYLDDRFGSTTHSTGAWFFMVSKMLGAAVRFYVVCIVLQPLVFGPLGVPFWANVVITIALIFLYTLNGGAKTIVWTDTLKSFCLILAVVLSIVFVVLGLTDVWGADASVMDKLVEEGHSRIFFFDNPSEGTYFWKQFIAGIFMIIAMTGLDQDLMQRTLACKDAKSAQKSLITATFSQTLVIFLFLVLGSFIMMYWTSIGETLPEKSDNLFGMVATHPTIPTVVGVLFVVGLVAAAYSAAGSALNAMTTSFSLDILKMDKKGLAQDVAARKRKRIHLSMAAIMAVVIIVFNELNSQDAISAVYAIGSYTYGPILGLFAFGMFFKARVRDGLVPIVCILAPVLSYLAQWGLAKAGYTMGFELLLFNAALTILGLCFLITGRKGQ